MNELVEINESRIKDIIYEVRGKQVMLDSDLAILYETVTGNINRAMKRNVERFPKEFCFQLTEEEYKNLIFQNGISSLKISTHSGRRVNPFVYTEQGVAMLSSVQRHQKQLK